MVGPSSSLFGGILAAGTLFIANYVLEYLLYRSKKVSRLVQGESVMLIYEGKVLPEHMKKAKISEDELEEAVREHGVEKISDVDLAVLERDGNISVLSKNFSHRTTRKRKAHKIFGREEG